MLYKGLFYKYTYRDNNGRLKKITYANGDYMRLNYDRYGNMVSEKWYDSKNEPTYEYVYAYDNEGNIVKTIDKALLKEYNYTYDAQGNPTNYFGSELEWEKGRQLKAYGIYSYTYNANGIRTSKTVDGVKHTYVLDGTRILKETWGTNTLIPLYNNEDNVCGICYNGTSYYFVKNLQGDVISLVVKTKMDEESRYVVVANYTYDAWGKCTVKDAGGVVNTSSDFVGNINPYRYRGYYYDVETGLYYLQSRYYDAEVGRFINGDKLYNSELLIFGNTYYYCNNNPTNCVDVDGDFGLGATSVGTIAMLGATNSWNPAGWIFIAVAATILVVGGSGIVIKTANSQTIKKTKRGTNTKILSDVKVKEQNGKPYQLAYVSIFGEIIRVGTPLSFIEALAYLGITGATNTLSQRFQYLPGKSSPAQRKLEHQGTGDWGIYAKSQSAAKALAVVFGFSDKPEIHGNGMYGHYHGGYYDASKDDYVHIFHIWYGGKKILGRQ